MKEIELIYPKNDINPFFSSDEILFTPLAGRTLIERSIDRLYKLGYTKIYINKKHPSEKLKSLLMDGTPWGIEIVYEEFKTDLHPIISPAWAHPSETMKDIQVILDDAGVQYDLLPSWQIKQNIWINRGVKIPSNCNITPPVFIGENVFIGQNVQLGPFACVENNSYIGDDASIIHSHILPGTLIQNGLSISDMIVNGNKTFDLRTNSTLMLKDDLTCKI